MFSQFFGQYLLNEGILTPEQLTEALDFERSVHIKLGILAMNAGYMTAAQVEEVHELQMRMDRRFGEIAIDKGYLTQSKLEDILNSQRQRHLSLGQAIIERGFLTLDQMERALDGYKKLCNFSEKQFQSLFRADYDEIVRLFLDFSDAKGAGEAYYNYTALLLRNIVRFLGERATIQRDFPLTTPITDWFAYQKVTGEVSFLSGLRLNDSMLLEIARRFSGEEIDAVDELALDSMAEFLNVHNGLFNVNMSNQGVELDMEPQKIVHDPDLCTGKGYCIPITLSFGTLELILAPQEAC